MEENTKNNEALMDDDEDEIITLMNEDNEEVEFYHIATLDYKEEWYIFLKPVVLFEGMDEDEIIIFQLGTDDEGNDTFLPIEDEALLQEVYDEFVKEMDCDCDGDCDDDCDCGCNDNACDDDCDCGCKEGKDCGCDK